MVSDPSRPAFMQPPSPRSEGFAHFSLKAETPDALDLLPTAKNHDVKSSRSAHSHLEDWVYALVSLQTMSGYFGSGNYGIARMNGGHGSRPVVALIPTGAWGRRWCSDVRRLLEVRDELLAGAWHYRPDGVVLTWVPSWDRKNSIALTSLDPFFIEVCRAARLVQDKERLVVWAATSKAPRIAARDAMGVLGDPWIPVKLEGKKGPQALTVGPAGLSAGLLRDLLFEDGFAPAAMQRPSFSMKGEPVRFSVSAFVRGQGTTDGFQHEEILIPMQIRTRLFGSGPERDAMAARSKRAIEEAGLLETRALKPGILSFLEGAGGGQPIDWDQRQISTWWQTAARQFRSSWSTELFPWLWRTADGASDEEADRAWLVALRGKAQTALDAVIQEYPSRQGRRFRSLAVAQDVFVGSLLTTSPNSRRPLVVPQAAIDDSLDSPSLAQTAALVARVINAEDFPSGERARLKRWSPGNAPNLAFYRFAFRHLPEAWEHKPQAWMTLLTSIALMCPDPHRPGLPLGRALARTSYAETRLERLLAAEGDTLHTLLLRAARYLRAKNTGCNCTDIAYLLGLRGTVEKARLRIARDYYQEFRRSQTAPSKE